MATAAVPIIAAIVGAYASSQMAPSAPKMQAPPAAPPQQAPQTPQAAVAGVKKAGGAGGLAGIPETLLTGMQGINPNALQLGKSTLLGQ